MKIIICDDKKECIDSFTRELTALGAKHRTDLVIDSCISGERLLFELAENPNEPDLIYMDINFEEKMDGIVTANKLRALGYTNEIVFLTCDKERVFESFDAEPLYYLIKDETTHEKFEKVFLKAVSKAERKRQEVISLSCAGETRNIPVTEILYFEVVNRLIVVHYGNGESFEFYSTIGKLENILYDKGFVRSHRAFLVSLSKIASISGTEATLINDQVVPIGRTYSKDVRNRFNQKKAV